MPAHDVAVELFYSGEWHDHAATDEVYTGDATHGQDIKIRHGKGAESGGITPAQATLVFRSWRFNPENVAGDLYGLIGRNTPLRITVDGDVRFSGEVASWTPKQSLGGDVQVPDRWVEVTAGGVLRRIQAGKDPLPSSLRRFYDNHADSPRAYWPLDAGQASRVLLPAFGDANFDDSSYPNLKIEPAAVAPWLESGIKMTDGSNIGGTVTMGAAPASWTVDAMFNVPTQDSDGLVINIFGNDLDSSGNRISWQYVCNPADWLLAVVFFNPDTGTTADTVATGDFQFTDGQPHHMRLTVANDGADVDWALYLDGSTIGLGTRTGQDMQGVGRIRLFALTGTQRPAFGHVAVWVGDAPALADTVEAAFGHAGEPAAARFARLCEEAGITDTVVGGTGVNASVAMGPQFRAPLAAQFAEIQATDDGLVYDTVTAAGITYRTGHNRWNHTPRLTLDYAAYEVAPPLDPVLDDQRVRNDVTATRNQGASFRAVDEDSVTAIGRYNDSVDVNVFSDLTVEAAAGWHLHTGSDSGTRFERVTVDLDATPGVKDDVVLTDVGRRIAIANLPAELMPDDASLTALGWTETIAPDRRKITFNTAPEAAYRVAELEHDDYATVGPMFTTLSGNHTATDTTIAIQPNGDGLWVYEQDFDIIIAGERMTVTAQGSGSGTFPSQSQILTVVRSVNGVVKAHSNGASVRLFYPSYIGI